MRKTGKLLILAALIVTLFVITAPAGASDQPVNKDGELTDIGSWSLSPGGNPRSKSPYAVPPVDAKFVVGQASYTANGKTNEMDAKTFIENGRTYVPIRYRPTPWASRKNVWYGMSRPRRCS